MLLKVEVATLRIVFDGATTTITITLGDVKWCDSIGTRQNMTKMLVQTFLGSCNPRYFGGTNFMV